MSQFIREIEPGVELFRDAVTGIAWAEDHRTELQGATGGFTTSTGLSATMRTRSRPS